jgi:hypothetical protein
LFGEYEAFWNFQHTRSHTLTTQNGNSYRPHISDIATAKTNEKILSRQARETVICTAKGLTKEEVDLIGTLFASNSISWWDEFGHFGPVGNWYEIHTIPGTFQKYGYSGIDGGFSISISFLLPKLHIQLQ